MTKDSASAVENQHPIIPTLQSRSVVTTSKVPGSFVNSVISPSTRCRVLYRVSKIERGDWDSLSDLRLIARVLGVPIEELVREEAESSDAK